MEYRTVLQQKEVNFLFFLSRPYAYFHLLGSASCCSSLHYICGCVCVCVCLQVDISHLKARQNSLQEEVQKLRLSARDDSFTVSDPAMLPVTTVATTTSSSSFLSRPSPSHHGFHSDEVDLSDVLWSQQEINRLSHEVQRLEADLAHWRRVAQVA